MLNAVSTRLRSSVRSQDDENLCVSSNNQIHFSDFRSVIAGRITFHLKLDFSMKILQQDFSNFKIIFDETEVK